MPSKKRIQAIIRKIYEDKYNLEKEHKINIENLHSGPYTNVFKCSSTKTLPSFFVKYKRKNTDDIDTQKEYEIISDLWINKDYNSSKIFCVPEPIAYVKKDKLLITNFIEGTLFSNTLSRYFYFSYIQNSVHINRHLKDIIHWLTDYEKRVLPNLNKIESMKYIEKYLDSKIDDIKMLTDDVKVLLKKKLVNSAREFPYVYLIPINTDFNPNNVIINDRKVSVIDWEKSREDGNSLWMPSTFFRYMNRYKNRIGTSDRQLEKLGKYFIEEYFTQTPIDHKYSSFEFAYNLQNITYLAETFVSSKPSRIQENCMDEIMEYIG